MFQRFLSHAIYLISCRPGTRSTRSNVFSPGSFLIQEFALQKQSDSGLNMGSTNSESLKKFLHTPVPKERRWTD